MKQLALKVAAVLAPPLVVVFIGSGRQKRINFILTALCYIPGSVHALYVVCSRKPHSSGPDCSA